MIVRHLELSPGTKTVKHLQLSIFHQSSCQFFEMSLIKIDIFDISLINKGEAPGVGQVSRLLLGQGGPLGLCQEKGGF